MTLATKETDSLVQVNTSHGNQLKLFQFLIKKKNHFTNANNEKYWKEYYLKLSNEFASE